MEAVVDLGRFRALLSLSDGLRQRIVRGRARGVAICVLDEDGTDTVMFAGEYENDPEGALRAAMAMVWKTAADRQGE